jgi:hypothetical protein
MIFFNTYKHWEEGREGEFSITVSAENCRSKIKKILNIL